MDTIDKENKTGIQKLHDFFYDIPLDQLLIKNAQNNIRNNNSDKKSVNKVIDFSWFFTEDIPQKIIKKTVARIMEQHNPNYKIAAAIRNKSTEDINQTINISASQNRTNFIFGGADNWTKLILTDKPFDKNRISIPTITLEQFEKEICKTIVQEQNPDYTPFLKGIHNLLDDAFTNLVEYYKYLQKEKSDSVTYQMVIDEPTTPGDRTHTPNPTPIPAQPRKSSLIPYSDRLKFLDEQSYSFRFQIEQRKSNGDIIPNAYTSYVYDNLLSDIDGVNPDGYLIVNEPIGGDKYTRIFYISKQYIENTPAEKIPENLKKIIRYKLEQNQSQFIEDGSIQVSHTDFKSFTDRLQFYLHGTKTENVQNMGVYLNYLRKLYKNPDIKLPYYNPRFLSKDDIACLGNSGTGRVDRAAQNMLNKENNHPSLEK